MIKNSIITDKKNTEEIYKNIFELSPGAIFVVNIDGRIIECNESVCEMFGYTKEELRVLNVCELLPGVKNHCYSDIINESLGMFVWLSCLGKDGRIFPVQFKSKNIKLSGQSVVLVNVIDIKEVNLDKQKLMGASGDFEEIPRTNCITWKKEDHDYVIIGYDKVMEEFTHGKLHRFLGKKAQDLYKNQPDILKGFNLCVQTKTTIQRDLPYCMFSANEHGWVSATFVYVSSNLVITYYNDITKRTNIETLFNESEKRRLRALEATNDGIWEWNIQTNQIITCPAHFTMLGYDSSIVDMSCPEVVTSYDELIGLVYEPDRDDFEKRLQDYVASDQITCEMELRLKTNTGGFKWVLKRGKVVDWDDQGRPSRMIGTNIDINERRQAEEALKQSEKRLRAQYMSMPLPIYTWQKNGDDFILSNFNIATEEFTERKISGFIGKKARILYSNNPEILEKIIEAYDNKTICKSETTYSMFSIKETRQIIYTCTYVVPDMVLVQMEDITKQKEAEENLRQSEDNLRDLTVQLFKAEENVRKYIAQELHDSIGQYLSSNKYIAENAICQINEGNTDLGCISLDKLILTIQETIDEVSRISMDLRPSVLDDLGIIATISWFCREYRLIYQDIKLQEIIEIDESDVPLNVRIHLFRIIQESLNNVACHSKASTVEVSLVKKNNRVELSISDDGIGFDIKEKLNPARENRIGFGLISMKERAHYLGGQFSVDSKIGTGTIVRGSWPCV